MGIQGLLPLLKSIHKPTHLRNFAGQTLGVDAYGWLHRGTISCAVELALQKPTRKHIDFALNRVRMLIHFGVKPYLVFDGAYLPSKEHTESERAAKRRESKKLGLELLNMDRISQAYLELQKAIDVTPTMARELIEELKRLDVPYVVAPYEADSQLAYLEKQNIISGVLSEDSDLLVFGVQCLLTKLDQYGECVMIRRQDFTACREVSLVGWTDKEFRMMAMLSGCDYLPGLQQMGLKTAYRLVRKHKSIDRVIRSVQFEGKHKVPTGYLEAFNKAERAFLYQWIYCPQEKCQSHLNPLPAELTRENLLYLGEKATAEVAAAVAAGDLDPNTKMPLVVSNFIRQDPAKRLPPINNQNENHDMPITEFFKAIQTPGEKHGKPISEFFKVVRSPLAELDPNSFTPSPSQRVLLQDQRGVSWSASQVQSSRPPMLSRAAGSTGSTSALPGTRRAHSEQWYRPEQKSPKRQRLCSNSQLTRSVPGISDRPSTTSRFFAKQDVERGSLVDTPIRQRSKKDEFELWSDDSTAEAMAKIAEIEESAAATKTPSPKKRKKIEIYREPVPRNEVATPPTADSSQATNAATILGETSQETDTGTPDTSFNNEKPRRDGSVFSKGIDDDFANLKAKYSFQSASPRIKSSQAKSIPLKSKDLLPEAGTDELVRTRRAQISPSIATQVTSSRNATTIEGNALDETVTVPDSSPHASLSNLPCLESGDTTGITNEFDDDEILEMEHADVSPSASWAIKGSEDCLIPNSPESHKSDGTNRPKLDLARFAFAGQY